MSVLALRVTVGAARSLVKERVWRYSLAVTEKLYHTDPSATDVQARIVGISAAGGRCEVVLDRTCFYPGGGGQPCDTGSLGGSRVTGCFARDDDIVHVAEPGLDPSLQGRIVRASVDAARRRDFMAQHTGQHIFSQALARAGSLETVSVHFGDEDTTIELKAEAVPDTTLRAAEQTANAVVRENRRVILHEIDREDAGKFPLRRTPPDEGRLRIVEVESFDWAACGGVHVASTGEVALIRAAWQEKIRGRVRLHVMIGQRALEDYGRKLALVRELCTALTCGEESVLPRVRDMQAREKETSRELRRLQAAQAAADADAAVASARVLTGAAVVRRAFTSAGPEYLKAFAERVVSAPGRIVIAVDALPEGFQWIAAHSLEPGPDLAAALPALFPAAGARGGGKGSRMQGVGTGSAGAFAEAAEAELVRRLMQEGE
jgi:alanyl-tRNA synthetase